MEALADEGVERKRCRGTGDGVSDRAGERATHVKPGLLRRSPCEESAAVTWMEEAENTAALVELTVVLSGKTIWTGRLSTMVLHTVMLWL